MLLISAVVSGVGIGAIYALVAAGLNLVFGVVKIINFAQGALLTVALYAVYFMNRNWGLNPYALVPVVAVLMGLIGLAIQVGLIDRVLRKERISQLLLTFGLGMALRNGILAAFGSDQRSVPNGFANRRVGFLGAHITVASAIAIGGSLVTVAVLYLFLNRTKVGTAIRAVAQQPESAELAGIAVRRIYAVAFAVGTALTGVAACLMAPLYAIQPDTGETFGLIAFIVVILGGLGSVFGAAAAAFVIGIIANVFAVEVSVQLSSAFVFLVFIVVMMFRPNGVFGRAARVA